MSKNLIFIFFLILTTFIVYFKSFSTFFAQDDFILINYFSRENLLVDLKNSLGWPTVSHWRPIHNFYFLITGNLFDRNYFGYHLLTFLFHIGGGFLIYKIVQKIVAGSRLAFIAALIYTIHPAHFVGLFWISGGATIIGFFFFLTSFYSWIIDKKNLSIILYVLAISASEAMTVGFAIMLTYGLLFKKTTLKNDFLIKLGIISLAFSLVKIILTPKITFDVYQLELSARTLATIKYYLLRTLGFAEVSGDFWISAVLLAWLALILAILIKKSWDRKKIALLLFPIITIFVGFFPFILIPNHLSPHYMNIPVFGFSILISIVLSDINRKLGFAMLFIFATVAFYNVVITMNNNWVIQRSNTARSYIQKIERENPKDGTTLVFGDDEITSSGEAFIVLGGGEAIKFWFRDRDYKTCFSAFEKC